MYLPVPITDVRVGDKIKTDNGESHTVSRIDGNLGYVRLNFTCGCVPVIEAPRTLVIREPK